MKRLRVLVLLLFLSSFCFSQGSGYNSYFTLISTSTGASSAVTQNSLILYHQLKWTVTGTVSSCAAAVDSSPDGITWTSGGIISSQTCTSSGNSGANAIAGTANYIRIGVGTFVGTGSVTFVYEGWAYNPTPGGGGSGTVTSVGLAMPSWLTVTNSPVTASGTLTASPATSQTSHQVIGTCGSATTFTPCSLVAADIPTLNQNTTGSAASFTGSLVGDVTGTQSATTVGKINGTSLGGLATGILKNTTSTGVPSIAVVGDITSLFTSCSGTQYLGFDGGCHNPGTGTVTSVATTAPITGGTITGSGTIACATCVTSVAALTLNAVVIGGGGQASSSISSDTTTTHALFATAGAPAFRAITAGDIPTLNQNTTGSAGSLTVLTTLGDTLYENATPANARLAGNTSATKNFLTQTGNGTISAAPAWGTIAAGDVPTLNQNTTGTAANLTGCTPSTAGSLCYWNGSAWTLLAGNSSGTNVLTENSSGVPSWAAGGGSTALSALTAATGTNSINNGNNQQTWNWALTGASTIGLGITENSAATNGAGSQFLVQVATIAGSTAGALNITDSLTGSQTGPPALQIGCTWNTTGIIANGCLYIPITNTASGSNSLAIQVRDTVAATNLFTLDNIGDGLFGATVEAGPIGGVAKFTNNGGTSTQLSFGGGASETLVQTIQLTPTSGNYVQINLAGTAAAPSLVFTDTTTGFFRSGTNTIGLSYSGATDQNLSATGVEVASSNCLSWSSTASGGGTKDTTLCRQAAGTLEINSGTGAGNTGNLQLNQITSYNGLATAGIGAAATFGVVSSTAQTAAIATSTLCATTCKTGQYMVNVYMDSTVTCSVVGAAAVGVSLSWTDETGAKSAITVPLDVNGGVTLLSTMALGNTTNSASGHVSLWSVTGNAIQYATTYTACTTGTGTYAIRLTATQLQ